MMFLTKDEIVELTGAKRRELQMQWLSSNGYKFEMGLDGTPKILRSFVESRLGFEGHRMQQKRPNFEVLINAAASKKA